MEALKESMARHASGTDQEGHGQMLEMPSKKSAAKSAVTPRKKRAG